MLRTCDGKDENLVGLNGLACDCGRTFDDVERYTWWPHKGVETTAAEDEDENLRRYHAASHAMQSGVAAEIGADEAQGGTSSASTPKHLRVGVNSAMVNQAAIARLLIGKGVITSSEYAAAIADEAEKEQRRYEDLLSKRFGKKVTLA